MVNELLEVHNAIKNFPIRGGVFGREIAHVSAVRGLSMSIKRGEVLGLVGESGCGKSTLGMLILRLIDLNSGNIVFDGNDITRISQRKLRPLRRRMQTIFQDPYSSLNPRMTIGKIIEEPLIVHAVGDSKERVEHVKELLNIVGLSPESYSKYPHEFSGGQRQRVGIARAIALTPDFIVADEPVSALDVSIRGDIINLMVDLKNKFSLTYLFISHDLNVVRHISDRIVVMYLGCIVEDIPSANLDDARHPYTRALISAIPVFNPAHRRTRHALMGEVPSPINPPSGCAFHTRCPHAKSICSREAPPLLEYKDGCMAACHFISEISVN